MSSVRPFEPPYLLTDGVVGLRGWEPADAEWYATVVSGDELIQRFTSESPATTADQVERAISALAGQHDATGFAICDALTGGRLGNIALRHENGDGEVSYWLAATARGQGAATRALRLLSRWAIDHLGLTELRLWTHAENAASRSVAERAGYRRDPGHDRQREVKGFTWQTVAYRLVPRAAGDPFNVGDIGSMRARLAPVSPTLSGSWVRWRASSPRRPIPGSRP